MDAMALLADLSPKGRGKQSAVFHFAVRQAVANRRKMNS